MDTAVSRGTSRQFRRRVGMHASRGRPQPLRRATARAAHAAAAMYETHLLEFSSNLLGRRPRHLTPGWALPDAPLELPPRGAACRSLAARKGACCRGADGPMANGTRI